MRTVPRLLLLLLLLVVLTMVLLGSRCGIHLGDPPGLRQREVLSIQVPHKDYYLDLLKKTEETHKLETESLRQQIVHLMQQLKEKEDLKNDEDSMLRANCCAKAQFYNQFYEQKLQDSEVMRGISLHNEYEVIPFCRFTLNRIYLVDQGMGKRVVEKPIGFKKKELSEVIAYGVEKLNSDRANREKYIIEDFAEGLFRTEPSMGTHYELYYRDIDSQKDNMYVKVLLSRPFGPIHFLDMKRVNTKKELIHVILPLSGRTDKFQKFMERFVKVGIKGDGQVFLTVVYFGLEGLNEVKSILGQVSKQHKFKQIKLVTLNESFSRGRGLQVGVQSWGEGDVLMFLCDVDIVFNTDYLERCRKNTEKGKKVYYPMVFSLYNPNVVYSLHNLHVPGEEEQLIISKDTGFWRDFGFGMTCQYRSDFLNLNGFDEQIVGWGMEDVLLYRKHVKSDLLVIRATDPGIFHLWHEKHCDPALPWEQYRGCIRSKALNEASHPQLGMLAFKEEVDAHKHLVKQRQ